MSATVEALLSAARMGPSQLQRWLDQHARELSPALAAEARDAFRGALQAQDVGRAAGAALAAAMVYLRCGRRYEALHNYLDWHQVRFMAADTVEGYTSVRESAQAVVRRAREIGARDLVAQGAILAADSAFFASELVAVADQATWLLRVLDDLGTLVDTQPADLDGAFTMRLASLLAATVEEVRSTVGGAEGRLRDVAKVADRLIPVDFAFEGDGAKSRQLSQTLADLSYTYGDAALARQRLDMSQRQAEQDVEAWVSIAFTRYLGEKKVGMTTAELMSLRRSMWNRIEEFRGRFRSRAGRLWAAQELDAIHGEFLRDEISEHADDDPTLFEAMDAGKARTLLDMLLGGSREFASQSLSEQAAEMERDFLRFEPEVDLDPLSSEMRLNSRLSIGTHWDRSERAAKLEDIEKVFNTNGAGMAAAAPLVPLDKVQAALRADEALIELCIPHHELHPAQYLLVIAVTSSKTTGFHVELPSDGQIIGRLGVDGRQMVDASLLGERVISLRMAIQRGQDDPAGEVLRWLHGLLIRPLIEAGLSPQSFRRWIVVPHGMLHFVPFGALVDDHGRYLVRDVAITHAPSASVWYTLQSQPRPSVRSFLGLANPTLADTRLPPLEAAEDELGRIVQALSGIQTSVYQRQEATESALRSHVRGQHIVHLATHGEFPETDAIDFHRVLLAPDAQHDGHVNAEEVRRMDLHAARLVVLSICNGGVFRFGPGDEPYGLPSAVLAAGAENVLGTLWPLEDQIGRLFMGALYKNVLAAGPAEALRQAALKLIDNGASLSQWAGFTQMGAGRPFA